MKTKDGLLRTEDVLLKPKDGLLKTEEVLLKTKDGSSVTRKLIPQFLTNISLWLSLKTGKLMQGTLSKRQNIVTEQHMTQVIMQAANEATKASVMVLNEADNPVDNARPIHTRPRSIGPVLRQPMFDFKAPDKYQEP